MAYQSVVEEREVLASIEAIYESSPPTVLERDLHIKYLLNGLEQLPAGYASLDASRPWLCYWIVHSLSILKYPLEDSLKLRVIEAIKECLNEDGGFGGGPEQLSHLAASYAAILTITTLRLPEGDLLIDPKRIRSWLLSLKQPSGAFRVHQDNGEIDVRGTYCAVVIAELSGLLPDEELTDDVAEFIAACQTFEGGLGAVPFAEAHAGYSFCGAAALKILGRLDLIDSESLVSWVTGLQCLLSGGFRGRTNKLVDGCYSFWSASIPILLGKCPDNPQLERFIVGITQSIKGGLRDKPGKSPDYYHTCYCLSGLSLIAHQTHRLAPIGPEFNIGKG